MAIRSDVDYEWRRVPIDSFGCCKECGTKMRPLVEEDLVRVNEMATIAKVPALWLNKQAKDGLIPHLRARRVYVFNPRAVLNHLAEVASKIPEEED